MNKFQQLQHLYARLDASQTKEETNNILADFKILCTSFSEAEKHTYQREILKIASLRLDAATENARLERQAMAVEYNGQRYESPEWLTVAQYARLHGAAIQKVFNWLKRGNIPQEDRVEIPELNNLKLIRNKDYELRKYQLNNS